ncbi:nucleotidyl transferase AbiEii/AbiGii toxin family protein, partial [Patescibacteria group bacterium]|nr:nucleotidyl transferase AbiEii/AbiGii toxin family protein [Patescibacteria group bacterium]MBU1457535.1 nucleotidyl transferase AbiEii/AbiGii toxin family protein [Patescibacteria group bacterium]
MIVPKPQDAKHKNQMFRLLRAILSDSFLANQLYFKGGTYASLQNILDRFSIDLDFDLPDKTKKPIIQKELHAIFNKLGSTVKLKINDQPSKKNTYQKAYLPEINMYCNGHTLDTMFANKLVAATDRFKRNGKIAGRDFYDLHQFFNQGLPINPAVVTNRTGQTLPEYLETLSKFINKHLT